MAGALSGIISDMRAREAMKQRENAASQAQMAAMLRALMTQQAIAQRQQVSPTAAREKRLASQFATKQADSAAQDKAMVEAVLRLTPDEVPLEWRGRLKNMQTYLAGNPSGALAKQILTGAKPHGYKLMKTDTVDSDPSSPTYGDPITSYEVYDPNENTISATKGPAFGGASSTTPAGSGGGAVRPSAAVAPTSPRSLSGAADHFYGKHFGTPDDDSGGP
jgi:hypothetical protein